MLLHIVRGGLDPDRFIRQTSDISRESLDQAFAAIARSLSVPVVAEVEHGRVTSSVADAVHRLAPTLIVLGGPDVEDIPDELVTTTALDLLRAVPYPMLVVLFARPRSFFGQLFHRSVTAHVLLHSPLPVLVLPAQE